MIITHASLFSGIGGFDLAAEWAGFTNLFNCEIDSFCRKILKYHFHNAEQYEDIRCTDFTIWRGKVDVLSGGFPCQPFSTAGKRKGTEDDRYLWPEMLRAIREIQPRWVLGENVRGIVNWNGGMVFEQVLADLEDAGYEVTPYLVPACGVGAPHRRDRVWFVAKNTECVRRYGFISEEKSKIGGFRKPCAGDNLWICKEKRVEIPKWSNFPTQSPVCSRDDGLPTSMDGITFSKWRTESIKEYGNAIVPQVAYRFFEAMKYVDKING